MDGVIFRDHVSLILDEEGIAVFHWHEGGLMAAIRVHENLEPLPGSDPADYGYEILSINYESEGLALVSVRRADTLSSTNLE